jgi:hypothetical protein
MKTAQKTASHSCGATWHQIASRTGHCCTCHRTFSSEEIFEAHRTPDGPTPCVDPVTLLKKDGAPRFEAFTDLAGCEVWRSTKRMSDARVASFVKLKAQRADE